MNMPFKLYWDLLVSYLRPQWRQSVLLAALLLGGIGLQLLTPQVLRYFIDTAQSGGPLATLTRTALLFLGVAVVQQLVSVATTYVGEDVGWSATNGLRADLALHCLRLDMSFHNTRTPGELIERVDGDVTVLANFFSQFVVRVLGSLLLLLGVLIILGWEDWRMGLAFAVFALITLAALNRIRDLAVPSWKAARAASANFFGFLEEHLAGTIDIRANGARPYVMRTFYTHMRERLRTGRAAAWMDLAMLAVVVGLFTIGQGIAFAAAFYLFSAGRITIGTVFLIVTYANILFWPLQEITNQLQDLQKVRASMERIQELYRFESAIPERPGRALPAGPLAVEFEGVSFGYTAAEAVLHGVSFRLQAGKVLGLLGRTGSGKTTLTRLLFRFYDPAAGSIRLGGVDLRDARPSDVRQCIGMVTQEVQLFHATVRDNLTLFDPRIPDARIEEVLRELGLFEWYRSLPHGLDTQLVSGGGLSAGEAQLLALTRVFLKDPGLVILDEASSRLDPATERRIERAIDRLLLNRTGIIIAHRLKTVERADEIMILEGGRVREQGSRQCLADDSTSRYAQLLQTGLEEMLA